MTHVDGELEEVSRFEADLGSRRLEFRDDSISLRQRHGVTGENIQELTDAIVQHFCVEDFGTRRLQSISREDVVDRYREFKKLTHFEDI